ncbi:hypothetical protein [Streptomyces sp. NPDC087787]|uniref:hypothetical protein n=1 Tax=Streptomyces sp. NPDC087787 TaxID=3365803 RepID=UPI00380CFF3A
MPSPSYVPVVPVRTLYAETGADFAVTGATGQTSTPLTVRVEAGRRYCLDAGIIFSCSNTTASVGLSWTGPTGATMRWNSTTASTGYRPTIGGVDSYTGSAANRLVFLRGRLVTAAADGLLTLTMSISDPAETARLYADSWLTLTRVP